MSFLSILNSLLLKPLELAFEVIYMMANRIVDNPGLSIIILSLAMNFLVLPLYKLIMLFLHLLPEPDRLIFSSDLHLRRDVFKHRKRRLSAIQERRTA